MTTIHPSSSDAGPHRLTAVDIDEISLVGKPANRRKFTLLKSKQPTGDELELYDLDPQEVEGIIEEALQAAERNDAPDAELQPKSDHAEGEMRKGEVTEIIKRWVGPDADPKENTEDVCVRQMKRRQLGAMREHIGWHQGDAHRHLIRVDPIYKAAVSLAADYRIAKLSFGDAITALGDHPLGETLAKQIVEGVGPTQPSTVSSSIYGRCFGSVTDVRRSPGCRNSMTYSSPSRKPVSSSSSFSSSGCS